MDRTEYTQCMTPHMQGAGKTKEQRQHDMYIGAKLCSGKAKTPAEGEKMCKDQPAKEPKQRKPRSGKSVTDPVKLATCVATKIDVVTLTTANLPSRLEEAIKACSTTKSAPARPPTYKRFMNACLKEAGAGGDFMTSQPVIKQCQAEWNKTRGA